MLGSFIKQNVCSPTPLSKRANRSKQETYDE
jgi:hypothetical protein